MTRTIVTAIMAAAATLGGAVRAADPPPLAARFGARTAVMAASISPDGKRVALVIPRTRGAAVLVGGADGSSARVVATSGGDPLAFEGCGWSSADRLVCTESGSAATAYGRVGFSRMVAFDADGGNVRALDRRGTAEKAIRLNQFSGGVVDWLAGGGRGDVLMARDYVPEQALNTRLAQTADGLGVDLVDTRNGSARQVERPVRGAVGYLSDGHGTVRMMILAGLQSDTGALTGALNSSYRTANSREWRPFGTHVIGGHGLRPLAVDVTRNIAYASDTVDGRDAIFSVSLDGSMTRSLVYADPEVDVGGVETIGRGGRVIGVSYVTDRRVVRYLDPEFQTLAASLAKALPKLPLVRFVDASADEKQLLIYAGSDDDPGRYYAYDRTTHRLNELSAARPELEGLTLSPVRTVRYPSGDGTMVPAYLTLPPGGADRHLPALVMPHGGPAARDEWGFDWMAQFFAQSGFAVLQPNFRGSTGYGDAWYADNGFKSWRTAVGDVAAGGRWLVSQGIADPDKLAILGWSYGGYAALQVNVVEPALFKAAVAIAPVTDFAQLKAEALNFTNSAMVRREVGDGPHIAEGSPARHANAFLAPVLLFHGDADTNVNIVESRTMDSALRRAGKPVRLVVYPGLDHQLDDAAARTDMLTQSAAFLRTALKLP